MYGFASRIYYTIDEGIMDIYNGLFIYENEKIMLTKEPDRDDWFNKSTNIEPSFDSLYLSNWNWLQKFKDSKAAGVRLIFEK